MWGCRRKAEGTRRQGWHRQEPDSPGGKRAPSRSSRPGMGAQGCGEELGTQKGSRDVTQTCSSLFRRCCPCWETRAAATTARSFLISLCFPPSQNRTIGVRIRGGGKKSPFVFQKQLFFVNKIKVPLPSLPSPLR